MGNDQVSAATPPAQPATADEIASLTSKAAVEIDLYERSIAAVREHRATERVEAERMLLTLRS